MLLHPHGIGGRTTPCTRSLSPYKSTVRPQAWDFVGPVPSGEGLAGMVDARVALAYA